MPVRITAISPIAPLVFQEIFVTIHLYSGLTAELVLLAAALWTVQAGAQTPADSLPLPAYRSALEGYQPYTDKKVGNWKEANDNVGRIGGWREYAKEASRSQTPEGADKPVPDAAPTQPRREKP